MTKTKREISQISWAITTVLERFVGLSTDDSSIAVDHAVHILIDQFGPDFSIRVATDAVVIPIKTKRGVVYGVRITYEDGHVHMMERYRSARMAKLWAKRWMSSLQIVNSKE